MFMYFHAVTGGWEYSPAYSVFEEEFHTCGLLNPATAFANVTAKLTYPNPAYGVPYRRFTLPKQWQASIDLY